MTLQETLKKLQSLGDAKVRAINLKQGADGKQFGVPLGEIRKLAKAIGHDRSLALELWKTGNLDAQHLAVLLLKPKDLTAKELDKLVRSISFARVADWLISYVVKEHPDNESLRVLWMTDDDRWAARAGWSLTAGRVLKSPEGLDLPALLDRIEKELSDADPAVQWTMNMTLGEIGIHHPKHRKRAVAIGEKIGLYRDWPVSKGCIPPYVPVWVDAMSKRKG